MTAHPPNTRPPVPRLTVITDTSTQHRFTHLELAEMACAGGADGVQFRDKSMPRAEALDTARRMLVVCEAAGAVLVVNDLADLAAEIGGAAGVHVGARDPSIDAARTAVGARALVGASAGDPVTARSAERAGADYVGFGHVFPTDSKHKPYPPRGPAALAWVCRAIAIPVVAVGGITAETAGAVIAAGAWGVAVIGAACRSSDPEAATAALRRAIDRAVAAAGTTPRIQSGAARAARGDAP